jgi:hypothetical protein
MALTAARSDLTISVVGEDETQAMLAEAQANMAALEGKIKSLQRTGQAQAATAGRQSSALGGLNSKMAGAAKGAEGLFEGLDKTKGAFEKIVGAVGFAGIAITGLVAIGGELLEWLSSSNAELAALDEELAKSKTDADAFAKSMDDMAKSIAGVVVSANTLEGKTASLRAKLAELQGDAVGAEFERRMMRELELRGQIAELETGMNEARAAQSKALAATASIQEELAEGMAREKQLAAEIAKVQMDAKLGIKDADAEITFTKSVLLQRTQDENRANRALLATTKLRTGELDGQVEALAEQRRLANEIMGIFSAQEFVDPSAVVDGAAPPKPPGGSRRPAAKTFEEELADIRAGNKDLREAQSLLWEDSLREARERESERLKIIADALKQEEAARKAAAEAATQMRIDETQPVYDFANALTSSLVPALSEVSAAMSEVTAIFDKYREGQIGVAEAVGMGATAIIAASAKAIGGVKAEAAVRAVYEGAMGFATLANPVISAGHFTAAAMLTGVATGVIGSGSGGDSKPARGIAARGPNTQQADNGGRDERKTIVINTIFGDKQSIAGAMRQAERSSRGTGYTRAVGV